MDKYYRILGLQPGASQAEVKKAFRRLAMELHPDRNPSADAASKFHEVNMAYEIIMGERKAPVHKRANPFRQRSTQTQSKTETTQEREERLREERIRAAHDRWQAKMKQEQEDLREYQQNYARFRKTPLFKLIAFKIMRDSERLRYSN